MAQEDVDVVVVGAGLAGLRAACLLTEVGRRVVVVEARDRVGGRTKSVQTGGNEAYDKGAGWVSPDHSRWRSLAGELGVSLFKQPLDGTGWLMLKGTADLIAMRNIPFLGGIIPYVSIFDLWEFQTVVWKLESMSKQLALDAPWTAARAHEWDSVSAWDWITANISRLPVRELVCSVLEGVFLAPVQNISLLWILFDIRSAGGVRSLSDDAQAFRVVEGSQELCLRMVPRLNEGAKRLSNVSPLRLNCAVCRIEKSLPTDAAVTVVVRDGQGKLSQLRARYVISAISPKLLQRIEFDRPVPRSIAGAQMFAGTGVKWTMTYSEAFWKSAGQSGLIVESDVMPWVFDGSTRSGSPAALVGFLRTTPRSKDEGSLFTTPESRKAKVFQLLERALGPQAVSLALVYDEFSWTDEEWSDKCVNGTPPSLLSRQGSALFQASDGRLFWAGTEAALRWNGYMEGAIESGEQAALAVFQRLQTEDGKDGTSRVFANVTSRDERARQGRPTAWRKFVGRDFSWLTTCGRIAMVAVLPLAFVALERKWALVLAACWALYELFALSCAMFI